MVLDFLLTNPGPIAEAARRLSDRLRGLVARLEAGDGRGLRRALEKARSRRARL
jgi:hypothetical protein